MNDGGKAFPSTHRYDDGMTLRDWFAGQAIVGILSSPIGKLPELNGGENKQAWAAYVIADAMIAAREPKA